MRSILKLFLFWLILLFTPLLKGWSQPVDRLLINELMINPNNVASLPPFEYIEFYNNGSTVIDLGSITLHINSNQISLPTHHLAPRQYVILCGPESVNEFARFGNAIGLSRGYALSNTGDTVKLTTNDEILDEVSYHDSWYNSSSKRNGGWSLERISPEWKCNINLNWSATLSLSDGTPGRSNTVWNKDFAATLQIQHHHIQQNKVEIRFQIDAALLDIASLNSFSLDEGIGEATDVHVSNGSIILTFAKVVDPQRLYTLQFNGLKLCNLASLQQNNIHLTSKTVSPNWDGYEDELEINYELMQPNYIIAVEIYNEKGQLMRK